MTTSQTMSGTRFTLGDKDEDYPNAQSDSEKQD
jgi:hypothetical protein